MKYLNNRLFFGSIIFLFIVFPFTTYAGDIFISPVSSSYTAGKIFTATINVRSVDKSVNAASGIVLFPTDKLEVVSISKSGSIINFWAEEPVFSNTSGTISFEGVVLNPGFVGASGKVISVNFKAKKPGLAAVSFSSGSLLANDGLGSNVLGLLSGANWTLNPLTLETPTTNTESNSINKLSIFNIKEVQKKDKTDPVTSFVFDSSQIIAGIDHYEISIDGGPRINLIDNGGQVYQSPILDPGNHTIIVRAVDVYGSYTVDSVDFYIEPLEPPKIIDYNDTFESNKTLVIIGETPYPEGKVFITISKNQGEEGIKTTNILSGLIFGSTDEKTGGTEVFEIKSDESGKFVFAKEKLDDGVYRFWARSVDDRGAKSEETSPITIVVKPSLLSVAGSKATNFLIIFIPLVSMLVSLALIVLYGYYKMTLTRKKLKKEITEAERGIHKAFSILREDATSDQDKDLVEAEKYIGKEIDDVKKELP